MQRLQSVDVETLYVKYLYQLDYQNIKPRLLEFSVCLTIPRLQYNPLAKNERLYGEPAPSRNFKHYTIYFMFGFSPDSS